MLSLKNISSKVSIIITAAARDDPQPIKLPVGHLGIHIAPGETRKVPQPTCGGSCLTAVWVGPEHKLVWHGVIPSTGNKVFEIDPEAKTVTYDGVIIPPAAQSKDDGKKSVEHFEPMPKKTSSHKMWYILLILLILVLLGAAVYYFYVRK